MVYPLRQGFRLIPFPHPRHRTNRHRGIDDPDNRQQVEGKGCQKPGHGEAYETHSPKPHENHLLLRELDGLGRDAIDW